MLLAGSLGAVLKDGRTEAYNRVRSLTVSWFRQKTMNLRHCSSKVEPLPAMALRIASISNDSVTVRSQISLTTLGPN